MSAIRTYTTVFQTGLQNTFVYRWNFLIRMVFSFIPFFGMMFFWKAIYAGATSEEINGYTFGNMVFYFLLVSLFESLVMPLDDEWQISSDIRDGNLNSFLLKPISYLYYRFSLFLAGRLVYSVVTIAPLSILFISFGRFIDLPVDPAVYFYTALALVLAATLQFLICYTIALITFWILEVSTLVFIFFSLEYFFSGHLFPLDLMPEWIYRIIKWTPFPYELYFPIGIFNQRISGQEMVFGYLVQIAWIIICYVTARFLWSKGLKKYTAVGG
ncbi:MAG: ABC-2 family transporter protein [Verrucomicrobiota bacterium]|nr:ABC-2 family transporter protein [Verrucomicrobiota bacterium]